MGAVAADPLRVLLAAQPELVTPVLQVVQRVVTRHPLRQAGSMADEGHGGAVTLIQRFGSAANPTSTCTVWYWTGVLLRRRWFAGLH